MSAQLPAWVSKYVITTAKTVPAYGAFLRKCGVRLKDFRSADEFAQILPIATKKNYILRFPEQQRLAPGEQARPLYASSGSSGVPTLWRLGRVTAEYGFWMHEQIFQEGFGIAKSEPTLVAVCYGMGMWVAGMFSAQASYKLADRGWNITTITPSLDEAVIAGVLDQVAGNYKNIVFVGFPTFMAKVLRQNTARLKRPGLNVKVLLGADAISEESRDNLLELIHSQRPADVLSIYGSADACAMGFESPLTIALRRKAAKDLSFYRSLYGSVADGSLPALYQFDPNDIYFESHGKELILTTRAASPLIRYNMHDTGRVVGVGELAALSIAAGKDTLWRQWRYPLVVYTGRTDVSLSYHAINLTAAQIGAWLDVGSQQNMEGYFAYVRKVKSAFGQELCYRVAIHPALTKRGLVKLTARAHERLWAVSTEYRKIDQMFGKRARPKVSMVDSASGLYKAGKEHGLLHLTGKKPKLV